MINVPYLGFTCKEFKHTWFNGSELASHCALRRNTGDEVREDQAIPLECWSTLGKLIAHIPQCCLGVELQ